MKLIVKTAATEEPPKSKKIKVKTKTTNSQYDKYSGIVNSEGKVVDKPTEIEAVKNMAEYMKNNQSDQSSKPSNVYRPEFSHLSLLYNRNKKEKTS